MQGSFKTTHGDVYIKDVVNHPLIECFKIKHPREWVHRIILRAFNEGNILLIITTVYSLQKIRTPA